MWVEESKTCSSWSKPFVTSLTPGLGFLHNCRSSATMVWNEKGNIWRYWTFDNLQFAINTPKRLNSPFPTSDVFPELITSLSFYCNFLLSQSRFWLPGYFFFFFFWSRQKRVGWSRCWLHCAAKGGTDRHGGTARAGCRALRLQQARSLGVIPQPGVTHIIRLIYITPPRGTSSISHRAKSKNRAEGEAKEGRESRNKSLNGRRTVSARGSAFRRGHGATLAGLFAPLFPAGIRYYGRFEIRR